MPHNHETTRRFESETTPEVTLILRKMTEGRRIELRKIIADPNRRIRDILRSQSMIEQSPEEARDNLKWLELQDEFDEIMITTLNPSWVKWGIKQIEGLVVDGKSLGVEDWQDWPSVLFDEALTVVKAEAELNGAERKNFALPTISGEQVVSSPQSSTAEIAEKRDGGAIETVLSTTRAE